MNEVPKFLREKHFCCVCGESTEYAVQLTGGEYEYPKIWYCMKHLSSGDDFIKRSTTYAYGKSS